MKNAWHQRFRRAPKINRTSRDGDVFDSKTELMRWENLRQRERGGLIRNLQRQVKFPLVINAAKVGDYTADFVYEEKITAAEAAKPVPMVIKGSDSAGGKVTHYWIEIIEDVKGFFDKASKFRIAVFNAVYGKKVTMVSLKHNRWTSA
jgi:hypothetical protein